jgi:small subunit ribosomal protein S15
MYINTEIKKEIFEKYGHQKRNEDTGSPESQAALYTYRINHLTDHLKENKKDVSSRTGLLRLVGKRKKLLNYLMHKDIERYRAVIKELGIRK